MRNGSCACGLRDGRGDARAPASRDRRCGAPRCLWPQRGREGFRRQVRCPRVYTRFEEMLDDREVDVVNVLTPNGLHRDFAVRAANAGKHVVVEKPLEINLARAQEIIAGVQGQRRSPRRNLPDALRHAAQRLMRAIDAGRLGQMLIVDVIDKEYRPPEYYARDYWRGTRELEGGAACLPRASMSSISCSGWPVRSGRCSPRPERPCTTSTWRTPQPR